jgi:hypothetical protein
MKIHQLLSAIETILTNEEKKFTERHVDQVTLTSLDEHDTWVAQNLVRKGVYEVSKDSRTLVKK